MILLGTACTSPATRSSRQRSSVDDHCPGVPSIDSRAASVTESDERPQARITVDPSSTLRTINPSVYGINHRYPYAGFGSWDVERNQPHALFLESFRYTGFPTVRFPGGRMANPYRWKRAIGPVADRMDNPNGGGTGDPLSNEFGPDEFGRLLELTGAEGTITANFATGTPQEAADWVEYMNTPLGDDPNGGTDWAQVRADNGHPEPYGIHFWEIGNEMNSDKTYWMGERPTDRQKATKYIFGGETRFRDHKLGTLTAHSLAGATSDGSSGLVRYARYPPVRPGTDQLYVDGEPWARVDDLSLAGPENVYEFDPGTGRVSFGDGKRGNIPPEGALLTMDYVSGPHAGFLEFYRAMKAVDPSIEIGSAIHTDIFTKLMGAEHPYDFMVVHTYGSFKGAPEKPKDLHDYLMLLPEEQALYISDSQRQIATYAGAARAREIDVAITEYAAGSGIKDGINSIDSPKHYLLSLDGALYTALLIREWIKLDIPLALKHSLVDSDPKNPPPGYTRSRTADAAVIGPAPCFLPSASAHVFKMYTEMLGATEVSAEIVGNPARITSEGDSLEALAAVATIDEGRPAILVINRDRVTDVTTEIVIQGSGSLGAATIWTLNGSGPLAYNTIARPNRVTLRETIAEDVGATLVHTFPAHSVTAIRFDGDS